MVWTVVESGDPAKDDAVAQGVEKRLTFLETAAALPPPDPDDPSSEVGPGPPVRVKFSVLRVKRNDPAEGPFLAMLAGPHAMPADEPWIAPAFGRGRVLGSWPASAMSDAQIEEACLFLIAGCSCQVKDLNPGWDLLLNLDWEKELLTIGLAAEPAAADSPKPAAAAPRPETVTIHGAEKPPVTEMSVTPPANTTRSWISLGAAGLLLALGAAWRRLRRKI